MLLSFDIGLKNLAWALVEKDGHGRDALCIAREGGVVDLGPGTLRDQVEFLVSWLRDRAFPADVAVVLEQQPFRHAKMYALLHALYACLRARGHTVHIVAARLKDSLLEGLREQAKPTYAQRKRAAVQACDQRLGNVWRGWMPAGHKADDLADAIVQGFAYLLSL